MSTYITGYDGSPAAKAALRFTTRLADATGADVVAANVYPRPARDFGKTNDLIRWAKVVTCGNRSIAEYVTSRGGRARVIPTVVDTERFRPPTTNGQIIRKYLWARSVSGRMYMQKPINDHRGLRRARKIAEDKDNWSSRKKPTVSNNPSVFTVVNI